MRLLRDLAALLGGEAVSKVAGFLAFAWLARHLAPAGYGAVELAAALALCFGLIVDFGLGVVGARDASRTPDSRAELAARIPGARLALALLAVPAMGVAGHLLRQPAATTQLIWIYALSLLVLPFLQRWLLQSSGRMGSVSIAQLLRMGVLALGAVCLVHAPDDLLRVGALEIAGVLAAAGFFLVCQRQLRIPLRIAWRPRELWPLLREAAPVGGEQVVWAANQYGPTLWVALFLGGASVGYFGGAHRIVLSIGAFVWLYHFNLYPSLARRCAAGPAAVNALLEPSMRVACWLGIGGALALTVMAPRLVPLAFGEGFEAAVLPFCVLVWALPISFASGHARFALLAAGEQRRELLAQLAGLAVTIVGGAAGTHWLGLAGAALTLPAAAAATWWVAHRVAKRRVAPLPGLRPAWRPLALAGALGLVAWLQPLGDPLLRGAGALAAYAAIAPLLDRRLLPDALSLAGARSDDPPQAASGPDDAAPGLSSALPGVER